MTVRREILWHELGVASRTLYNGGCRCANCVAVNAGYQRDWRLRTMRARDLRLLHGRLIAIEAESERLAAIEVVRWSRPGGLDPGPWTEEELPL